MTRLRNILYNRNSFLIAALLSGLLLPWAAQFTKLYLLYILMALMSFSLMSFSTKDLRPFNLVIRPVISVILLNYILFGGLLMGLAWLFFGSDSNMMAGFLCIALAPPGVVIVPFSKMIHGDVKYSTLAVLAGYLLLLIIMPVMLYFMEFQSGNSMRVIIEMIIMLVILPLFLSRISEYPPVLNRIKPYIGKIINTLFAVIVYTVIGLNRDIIINNLDVILLPMLVLSLLLFGGGYLFRLITIRIAMQEQIRRSLELIFSVKNTGFAAVLCLALFGEKAAIPSAALSVILLIYLIWLSIKAKRQTDTPASMGVER